MSGIEFVYFFFPAFQMGCIGVFLASLPRNIVSNFVLMGLICRTFGFIYKIFVSITVTTLFKTFVCRPKVG